MKRRGVSIIETVMGFAILAMLITFVFNLVPAAVLAIRQGLIRVEAQQIAASVVSDYRSRQFAALVPGTADDLPDRSGTWGVTYQTHVDIREVPPRDEQRLVEVKVTVSWEFRSKLYTITQGCYRWNIQKG